MSKAGIAIDAWKLPIFEKYLNDAGYTFKATPTTADGQTLMLTVETDSVRALALVVVAANTEARRQRAH